MPRICFLCRLSILYSTKWLLILLSILAAILMDVDYSNRAVHRKIYVTAVYNVSESSILYFTFRWRWARQDNEAKTYQIFVEIK